MGATGELITSEYRRQKTALITLLVASFARAASIYHLGRERGERARGEQLHTRRVREVGGAGTAGGGL